MNDFGRLIKAEIEEILEFQKNESKRRGYELSRNEAGELWADRYAEAFRKRYDTRSMTMGKNKWYQKLLAWVKKLIGNTGNPTTPTTPTPSDRSSYVDPVVPDHGTPFEAVSPDGQDRWEQYPDGYFKGFLSTFDQYSIVGMGKALAEAGGEDCSNAPVLGAICKPINTVTWNGVTIPNKVEWRIIVKGGWEAHFSYSHAGDTMGDAGQFKAIDMVKGVHVWLGAQGYNKGGKRAPHVYKDQNGKEWPTGIRYPYQRCKEAGIVPNFDPQRAPTVTE